MLSHSLFRLLIVLALLLTGCDVGALAIASQIKNLQPLRVIDEDLTDGINGINKSVEEFNSTLAQVQTGGIPILFTADAGPELKAAADDFNRAVADLNNLKVGLDEETLTQLAGLAAILNAGLKVGLDKESLYELRHLTDTLAKTPENFEKSLVEAAPKVSKAVGDTLISVLDEARTDMEKLTAVIGVEGRCTADYLQSKADAFIGRSIMSRVMARFGNSSGTASTIAISGVCQVVPAQIDLVWVNDQLNAADNSKNVQLYGYGLANASVQIFDDSGEPVLGLPQITPFETTRYLVQINIQGIDFSQVGYRYRFVVKFPGSEHPMPIFPPSVPTWTPTPEPTTTSLPQPMVTCLKDSTPIHENAYRETAVLAYCNKGNQLRAISGIPEGTWVKVDVNGTFGYIYINDVELNVPYRDLQLDFPPPPPTARPPTSIPPSSCFFGGSTTINLGGTAHLTWGVENVQVVALLYDGKLERVSEHGERDVSPSQTTTYRLVLKDMKGQISECESVTITVVQPVPQEPPPPRRAHIVVIFTGIHIIDASEPGDGTGEIWLDITVNDQSVHWPDEGFVKLDDDQSAAINVHFDLTLTENNILSLYVNGMEWDEDNPHDPMGVVKFDYRSSDGEWSQGAHIERGIRIDNTGGDGAYEISYTISVTWE